MKRWMSRRSLVPIVPLGGKLRRQLIAALLPIALVLKAVGRCGLLENLFGDLLVSACAFLEERGSKAPATRTADD